METLHILKNRRSINFFDSSKTISNDKIKEIIEIANLSPSSFNLQPWEVIVVSDPAKKKILRESAYNQEKVEEASAVLIVIANPNAVEENVDNVLKSWAELGYIKPDDIDKQRGAPFSLYGDKESLNRKLFAVKNTAFFGMSIMIAARALGYETHPMDGFNTEKVKKAFNIPEDRLIPLLIAVGYPKPGLTLLPRAFRRKLDSFVKFDRF